MWHDAQPHLVRAYGADWQDKLKAGEVLFKDDEGVVEYCATALTVKVQGKRYKLDRPIARGTLCEICICSGDYVIIQYPLFSLGGQRAHYITYRCPEMKEANPVPIQFRCAAGGVTTYVPGTKKITHDGKEYRLSETIPGGIKCDVVKWPSNRVLIQWECATKKRCIQQTVGNLIDDKVAYKPPSDSDGELDEWKASYQADPASSQPFKRAKIARFDAMVMETFRCAYGDVVEYNITNNIIKFKGRYYEPPTTHIGPIHFNEHARIDEVRKDRLSIRTYTTGANAEWIIALRVYK